jgi:hypothetical protein
MSRREPNTATSLQVMGLTLGAKGNRVIAIVVDPVAGSGLMIVAVAPTFCLFQAGVMLA